MSKSDLLPNEEKRRFTDLRVDEVSLVDSPANEEEFAIIKRQQEENMATEVKEEINKAKEKDEKAEVEGEDVKKKKKDDFFGGFI